MMRIGLQMQAMVGYMACGTAFFDTFFLDATNAGLYRALCVSLFLWRHASPARNTHPECQSDGYAVIDSYAVTKGFRRAGGGGGGLRGVDRRSARGARR